MTYYSNKNKPSAIAREIVLDRSLHGENHGNRKHNEEFTERLRHNEDENVKSFFSDRVEKLRELYSEMEPEYTRICTYKDPVDGQKNVYENWEVKEGVSPFELDDFEDRMPQPEDYFNPEELKEVGNELKRTLS